MLLIQGCSCTKTVFLIGNHIITISDLQQIGYKINKINNDYYKGLQFTIIVNLNGQELNIGDGGFVDWSQKLLSNKKERMMISAIGLDKILHAGSFVK